MTQLRTFTSESVTEGHPDKICDRISDAILDELLREDPEARVAVECLVTTGQVHVAGEIRTEGYVDIPTIVRREISAIGYTSSEVGFDGRSCGVSVSVGEQSADIAAGVDKSLETRDDTGEIDPLDVQGAGDQGLMFGYATDETDSYMPLPIHLSHRLAERLAQVRREGTVAWLRPDGKTQVTVGYGDAGPEAVTGIVVSTQHDEDVTQGMLDDAVRSLVVDPVLDAELTGAASGVDAGGLAVLVNPTGRFVLGGPMGDAGLTGRKIIVDTYGGMARHGGGAFSGKDPSKVDRSAAYAMRWVAKNVVAAGLARRCEVQVAYAIGQAAPVSIYVETFGTAAVPEEAIERAVREVFDLRPLAVIRDLELLRPIYRPLAAYGHFGRPSLDLPWERLDRVDALRSAAGV
ncbi:methionine adenosyltransferase [Georgenia sp. Z1344]|uniref:methionine adenosyltransferase n=1 Tax=Georgenia sp. Z1344 TaxID=3416706 RepID=UPI003CE882AD